MIIIDDIMSEIKLLQFHEFKLVYLRVLYQMFQENVIKK
jgi:hypothetical protein